MPAMAVTPPEQHLPEADEFEDYSESESHEGDDAANDRDTLMDDHNIFKPAEPKSGFSWTK